MLTETRSELIATYGNPLYMEIFNNVTQNVDEMHTALHVRNELQKRTPRLINGIRKLIAIGEILEKDFNLIEPRRVVMSLKFPDSKTDYHEGHDFYLVHEDTDNLIGTANRYLIQTKSNLGDLIIDVHAPKGENEIYWAAEKLKVLLEGKIPDGILKEIL